MPYIAWRFPDASAVLEGIKKGFVDPMWPLEWKRFVVEAREHFGQENSPDMLRELL